MSNNQQQPSLKERAEEIDDILRQLEDYIHGEDGKLITKARRLLIPITEALQSQEVTSGLRLPEDWKKKIWNAAVKFYNTGRAPLDFQAGAEWVVNNFMPSLTESALQSSVIPSMKPMLTPDQQAEFAELIDEQIHYGNSGFEILELLLEKWPESPASSSVIPHNQDNSVEP